MHVDVKGVPCNQGPSTFSPRNVKQPGQELEEARRELLLGGGASGDFTGALSSKPKPQALNRKDPNPKSLEPKS